MIAIAAALLSGTMFYLSQGIDNVWPLAWIAPVPVLWLAYGEAPRWQVWLAALTAFAAGQIYLVQCYGSSLPPLLLVLGFTPAALFSFAVNRTRAAYRALPPIAALFAFPALWTASEYLISLVSPGGSFGSLAYSQVSAPMLVQTASLFGYYAVTFLICLTANAIAFILRRKRANLVAGALGLAICAAAIGFGYLRLNAPQGSTVAVAALANEDAAYVKASRTGDVSAATTVTTAYADAIHTQAARGTKVFLTPEGSVVVRKGADAQVLVPLHAAAAQTGTLVVAGVIAAAPARDLAIAFMPDGRAISYAKRHLLLPLEARFAPGRSPGLIGDGIATVICKDMDFPRTIRSDAAHSIRLMMVPAGDFGLDRWIHARMAIMRGVENGFAVLRSAFNGLETISDDRGQVLAQASVMRPGMIITAADVPLGGGPTLYTRIGDIFAIICAAASALLIVWTMFLRRTLTTRAE